MAQMQDDVDGDYCMEMRIGKRTRLVQVHLLQGDLFGEPEGSSAVACRGDGVGADVEPNGLTFRLRCDEGEGASGTAAEIEKAAFGREFELGDVREEFFGGHPGVLAYVLTIGFRAELAHERGIEVFVEFVVGSGHGLKILCDIANDCRTERRGTHLEQTTRMGHRAVASDQYAAPSRRSLSVPWKGKRYNPVVTGSSRNRLRLQGIELVRGACD